jgi:hypothetical protein
MFGSKGPSMNTSSQVPTEYARAKMIHVPGTKVKAADMWGDNFAWKDNSVQKEVLPYIL